MPEDKSQSGFIHGSIWDSDALSRETRDVLELGLAALAFGTPAASEAGSMYGSMRGGSLFGSTRGYAAAQEAQVSAAPGSNCNNFAARTAPGSSYSSYVAYIAAQRPSPAVQQQAAGDSGRRNSSPVRPEPGDFGRWLNESAITAIEKTPVPVSPAFPGDHLAHGAEPAEKQMRRALQEDVADLDNITGVSGRQEHRQKQVPQEADITPDEAAEREAIRREIQEKMAVLRRQNQAAQSQANPVSPTVIPMRAVASPVLMQQQSPMAAPKSGGSATTFRDGDTFWKDLLNDLKLVGNSKPSLVNNDLDAMNRDYAHDSMTGSYPSSLVSSRSQSPCALDNPVRAAAKREILLGASLSSDYGLGGSRGGWERDLSNDGEYSASESRGLKFHRHPDLGPNWQKDLHIIGSQALDALNRASNQSYTDSLIQQMRGGSGAAVPQHVDLPAAAYQAPGPGMYSRGTTATQRKPEPPRDLRVRCTVGDGGAMAHATWQAAWDAWRPVVHVDEVTFEVQMIVRWLPGQAWNTMFTVKEPYCTVRGLKAKSPFAVRVRAIAKNWSSDYTLPVEFVTEQSQSSDQVATEVAADVSQATRAAQRLSHQVASTNAHSESLHRSYYLERVLPTQQATTDVEPNADSRLHHTQQPSQIQHPQHQAPVGMRTLSPLRTLAPVIGSEPGRPMHTLSSEPASHAPQTQRITLDDPENPYYSWAQRVATATPAVHQQVNRMAPVRTAEPSNASYQISPRVDDSKAKTYSSQPMPLESKAQAAGVPMPLVRPAVRRITLDDPENPHYGWASRNPTATPDANSLRAPPPVSSAGLLVAHAGEPEIYGSIYQAHRSAPMEPVQKSFHNAHLINATSNEDLGPLARALGVTQYQDASALGESKLVRAVAQPASSTGVNLPVARAVRVSTTPNDVSAQANK